MRQPYRRLDRTVRHATGGWEFRLVAFCPWVYANLSGIMATAECRRLEGRKVNRAVQRNPQIKLLIKGGCEVNTFSVPPLS